MSEPQRNRDRYSEQQASHGGASVGTRIANAENSIAVKFDPLTAEEFTAGLACLQQDTGAKRTRMTSRFGHRVNTIL